MTNITFVCPGCHQVFTVEPQKCQLCSAVGTLRCVLHQGSVKLVCNACYVRVTKNVGPSETKVECNDG